MVKVPFENRVASGKLLAAELRKHPMKDPIVLALPRGGVPIGCEIAKALDAPLDVVVVRKLGVPWQPELAMGAIAGGSFQELDKEVIGQLDVSQEEIEHAIARERAELRRREQLYRGGRPAPDLHGRTVILVDDGLATGATMTVAVKYARSLGPAKIIIAVPVGASEACKRLAKEVDELVCLHIPEWFSAVGEWYCDFRQVSDGEVQDLLKESEAAAQLQHRL